MVEGSRSFSTPYIQYVIIYAIELCMVFLSSKESVASSYMQSELAEDVLLLSTDDLVQFVLFSVF